MKLALTEDEVAFRDELRAWLAETLPTVPPEPPHDDDWVVLGIEYVDARNPARPWRPAELDACLDALEAMVPVLTPPPDGLELDTFADEYADLVGAWDHIRATRPELPHLEEAAELAGRFAEVTAGDTLVHTDIRDDNLMLDADGTVWICDWNWPSLGAAWMDTVFALSLSASAVSALAVISMALKPW